MKEGILQQLASPQEIYDRPANLFVAGFMGSPPMNFIRATLTSEDHLTITTASDSLQLPLINGCISQQYIGKEVILGIRPEMITEPLEHKSDAAFTQVVSLKVLLKAARGADTIVQAQFAETELRCRINPTYSAPLDQHCDFMFDMSKAVFFDPETELLI
jgi:multiple sugar transport system ATP-binding protein